LVADSFRGNEADTYQALEQLAFDEKADPVKRQNAKEQLEEWTTSNYFLRTLLSIEPNSEKEKEEMNLLTNYWLREFPKIGERTSSIVIESFMGIVEPFLNEGILKSHFSAELSSELLPENCFLNNQIVIIDFPVKEYGVAALFAATIYKTAFQAAMERRDVELEITPKPVGLFIDEYQQFCTYKTDVQFQATARSSWVATVYITQNLDGIVNVMGGNQAQERARSLLGNLNLKYFCSNGNYSTNLWASNMIGKHLVDYENLSISADKKISKTKNQQLIHRITPDFFTTLKTGRKRNKYIVESVVFKVGRFWRREKVNFTLVRFCQKE
jgi:type IV secretory pathway TraG/TraD family ATPase VirD4